MTRSPSQTDIDTKKITKIVTDTVDAYKDRSGAHDRIHMMEEVMSEHTKQIESMNDDLQEGRLEFLKLRNSIDGLTDKFNDFAGTIKSATTWFIGAVAMGLLTTVGTILWWAIKSYAIQGAGK